MSRVVLTKQKVLNAMIRAKGIVSTAAKLLHTSPASVNRVLFENPEIQDEIEACHSDLVDEALKSAKDLVENRDREMTKFVLSTFGKNRGIKEVKSVQISGDKNNPLNIKSEVDLTKLSDDELDALKEILEKDGAKKEFELG